MIKLFLGNIGSGKSLCAVREMVQNIAHKTFYTNIIPKKPRLTPHIKVLKPEMIIEKEITGYKKKKDGSEEPVIDLKLNSKFWKEVPKPISVVLDEAHDFMNARRSASKVNIILGKFLALTRRILGESDYADGDLIFITQLDRRIDIICREMAHQIRYHVCHYQVNCLNCGCGLMENSETPERAVICPLCHSHKLKKSNFSIEVKHFCNIFAYTGWKEFGMKTWHRHYIISDIEKYFEFYNTLQWDNLFEDYY